MLSEFAICFENVFKKYSKAPNSHGTIRDEIVRFFRDRSDNNRLKVNEFYALKDVSLGIRHGESIGLYGPNGSGKSTLLKLVANVISPTRGTVSVEGRIAPLIELGAGFHPDLNGIENIYMNGAILGMKIGEIKSKLDRIIEYSSLNDFISTPVKKYSSGMKLRLGFSIAIHSDADIYLLDEILAVGDEEFQEKSNTSIKKLMTKNKTLIIVSHDMEKLSGIADRIVNLKNGLVVNG